MSEPEPSTSVSPLSFLSIQRQQLDQDAAPTKTKKSLRETQEEEQARAAAKKAWQQEDFMCWWAAEEDGIHRETGVHLGPPITISASSGSKARKKPREKGARKKPPLKRAIANVDIDALQTQAYP
ncbi:hypothetical protein DFH11DRAFT_1626394 [Phellopilus nigrolimitatus]|nr:hypothetical protein DFH11DRAFT_1648698 [Phellopilus nigrolimitatus]KAH8109681.1 hypothetical protein DFH11DRAFT_1626394 [Phellopilus nigrolimitatus]